MLISSVRLRALIFLLTSFVSSVSWSQQAPATKPPISDFDLLDTVYQKMNTSYVEKTNLSVLIRKGFDASLKSLDPYSSYISEEDSKELQLNLAGKIGGVGMAIRSIDGQVTAGQVFEGYAADMAGIRVGDIILQAGGVALAGKPLYEAVSFLRGVPGTDVEVMVQRPGQKTPFSATLTRKEVLAKSVPYYGILNGNIGYIRITYETATSAQETAIALNNMRGKAALKGLILDLRDNGGGYEKQARNIINLFVEKGTAILSERNRYGDTTLYTTLPATDTAIPIAILVNSETKSAAEIISGAIQDLDRGIIVGQKTFGKGLVQELFKMPTGEILRITTAYYHTPSGRCIQNKSYNEQSTGTIIADSLKRTFKTKNGRLVKDHDGITPDVPMEAGSPSLITTVLADYDQTNNIIFKYATQYCLRNPGKGAAPNFRLSDSDYADFISFFKASNLKYEAEAEKKLNEFKRTAMSEGYWSGVRSHYEKLQAQLMQEKERDFMRHQTDIRRMIEGEIISRYHYHAGRLANEVEDDEMVMRTTRILLDQVTYRKLLSTPN